MFIKFDCLHAFLTGQGYLKSLTFPKSSAVAKTSPLLERSTEFTSLPSEHGGLFFKLNYLFSKIKIFNIIKTKFLRLANL